MPSIMSFEEYNKSNWSFPYRFIVNHGDQVLYYFGERHIYDPVHPQWMPLKEFWNDFIEKTEGTKRVVMIEGGIPREHELVSEQGAIRHASGVGLVAFFARQKGVEIMSPEPNKAEERALLEKEFSRDEIQLFFFSRRLLQWFESRHEGSLADYMQKSLRTHEDRSGWNSYDFSMSHMEQLFNDMFGVSLHEVNEEALREFVTPLEHRTVINNVCRRCSAIRDERISFKIAEKMKDGYSIFAQFGGSHAVMQEPYLRSLLER